MASISLKCTLWAAVNDGIPKVFFGSLVHHFVRTSLCDEFSGGAVPNKVLGELVWLGKFD